MNVISNYFAIKMTQVKNSIYSIASWKLTVTTVAILLIGSQEIKITQVNWTSGHQLLKFCGSLIFFCSFGTPQIQINSVIGIQFLKRAKTGFDKTSKI